MKGQIPTMCVKGFLSQAIVAYLVKGLFLEELDSLNQLNASSKWLPRKGLHHIKSYKIVLSCSIKFYKALHRVTVHKSDSKIQ